MQGFRKSFFFIISSWFFVIIMPEFSSRLFLDCHRVKNWKSKFLAQNNKLCFTENVFREDKVPPSLGRSLWEATLPQQNLSNHVWLPDPVCRWEKPRLFLERVFGFVYDRYWSLTNSLWSLNVKCFFMPSPPPPPIPKDNHLLGLSWYFLLTTHTLHY